MDVCILRTHRRIHVYLRCDAIVHLGTELSALMGVPQVGKPSSSPVLPFFDDLKPSSSPVLPFFDDLKPDLALQDSWFYEDWPSSCLQPDYAGSGESKALGSPH